MLKVLELFAGIGACSKALTRLGIEHEIVDAVEIDKYAVKSFNAIHGTNFEPQDIKEWDKDIECDLIMHGSPCQDFSVAGLGKGGDKGSGTRSSLMYETLRIVEKLKPKYVIWENVKNLISKKHKHNFDAYIECMKELGYESKYQVLNAKDYGIPQNRERVFTVSILGENHFEFPKPFPLEKHLKDVLEPQVDEKFYLSDQFIKMLTKEDTGKYPRKERFEQALKHTNEGDEAGSITTRAGSRPTDNFIKEPTIVAQRGRSKGDWHESEHFQQLEPRDDGLTNTLSSVQKDNYVAEPQKIGNIYQSGGQNGNIYTENGLSPTLRSGQGVKGCGIGSCNSPKIIVKQEDNYVAEPTPLQKEVCNRAIEEGYVEPNDAIEYTYSNARLNEMDNGYIKKQNIKDNTIMSTLKTNPQQIGITVDQPIKVGETDSHQKGGVYSDEAIAPTMTATTYKQPIQIKTANKQGYDIAQDGDAIDLTYPNSTTRRGRVGHGVSKTLPAEGGCMGTLDGYRIRKLTPKECWRLMGFDDEDFEKAEKVNSNAQLYKQAGNSIVVDVLENILRNLLKDQ